GDLTGVPCIMNTSFNDAGEPIVETPEDAIICFCGTEMDYLVLGDKLVSAEGLAKAELYKQMTEERAERIARYEAVSMQRYFPGYDAGEKDSFIASSNAMSEYHVRYRPKFVLEQKLCDWSREKKRILVVGTPDHTDAILRRINGFYMVDIVGFVSFDGRYDLRKDVSQPLQELPWDVVAGDDYDEILLSSFEYLYDVRDRLKSQGVTRPVFEIYDNASRNLMETLDDFPEFQKSSTLG
ncbi:MAG: carbamoyltransferase C-terminal domain-containing protein, partial [Rhodospirillales bacterium]